MSGWLTTGWARAAARRALRGPVSPAQAEHSPPEPLAHSEDVSRLARGATITLGGNFASSIVRAAGQILLARILGPKGFGLYAIGSTLTRIGEGFARLGLSRGVIYYGARFRRTDPPRFKGVLEQGLAVATVSGLLFGGVLYLAAPWLASVVFRKPALFPVIRWFSPAVALGAGLRIAAAGTQVSQRMQYGVFTNLVTNASFLTLLLVVHLAEKKLKAAAAAYVVSRTVGLLLAGYYLTQLFPEALSRRVKSIAVTKELFAFSLPAFVALLCFSPIGWIDRLLVGYFHRASEVGVYQAASQFSILFTLILLALNAIFSPMIAELYGRREMGRLGELFRVSTKWSLYSGLVLFLVIAFAPRQFLVVFYGPGYRGGALALLLLSFGQLINAGTGPVVLMLLLTGNQKRLMRIFAAALFVDIALCLLLIPRFGASGAALATSAATGGSYVAILFAVKRHLAIWPYDKRCLKGLRAAAMAAAALLLLGAFGFERPLFRLFWTCAVGSGVFVAVLLMSGLDGEDWQLLHSLRFRAR